MFKVKAMHNFGHIILSFLYTFSAKCLHSVTVCDIVLLFFPHILFSGGSILYYCYYIVYCYCYYFIIIVIIVIIIITVIIIIVVVIVVVTIIFVLYLKKLIF